MAICYYITSHGLGHAVRSAAVINQISRETSVIVRSKISATLLAEEIQRPIDVQPAAFDCGAIQKDSFTVDPSATLAAYANIAQSNLARLEDEVEFLKQKDVDVVVSDIASFPFVVARRAGIPGIAIGNFTWSEIYQAFVTPDSPWDVLLRQIRWEYSQASLGLRLPFSCPMNELTHRIDVPLVCRKSKRIRSTMAEALDLDPRDRWVALYLGQYPSDFDRSRLARMEGYQFLSLGRSPLSSKNVTMVDPTRFHASDMIASCDVALGKPGYSTIADCIVGDTPLVYALPTNFAEAPVLDAELMGWGRAVCMDLHTLCHGDLRPSIEAAIASRAKKSYDLDGARTVAEHIVQVMQQSLC